MVVLDTTFLIDLHAGDAAAERAYHEMLQEGADLLVPAIVAAEYLAGVPLEKRLVAWQALGSSFTLVHPDAAQVLETARAARAAFDRGRFPGWSDAQIGALAMLRTTEVVTADIAHYQALGCGTWDYRATTAPPPG